MSRCASSVFASCPAPRHRRFLGAGLHLSLLSHFRGPAQLTLTEARSLPALMITLMDRTEVARRDHVVDMHVPQRGAILCLVLVEQPLERRISGIYTMDADCPAPSLATCKRKCVRSTATFVDQVHRR